MAKQRTITSTDVAREAGVSRATVSAVLTGTQGNIRVSAETERRVRAVATALGYSPHPVAQALRRQRGRMIAFVPRTMHATAFGHPIAYQLALAAARAAARHGYHVVEISPEPGEAGDGAAAFLLSRRPDGVIFDAPSAAHDVEAVIARDIPVVQLLRPLPAATATVIVDATPGIAAAVDHLVALGHRRIAFVGTDDPHIANRSRLNHFRAALARHALELPAEYLLLGADYTLETGEALMRSLLARSPLPTALFAASDFHALGVLRASHAARLWVPDAISILSYDDVYASLLSPPLTSVAQPLSAVAEAAVAYLVAALDGGAGDRRTQHVFPTTLNVRASTAPPPAGTHTAPAALAIDTAIRTLGTAGGTQ